MPSSRLEGLHKLTPRERLRLLVNMGWIPAQWAGEAGGEAGLLHHVSLQHLDLISENVVGVHSAPLSIVPNLVLNGRELLIPFCTEEPSVVAACSKAALLTRGSGGVTVTAYPRRALAQLLVRAPEGFVGLPGPSDLEQLRVSLATVAAKEHPRWDAAGGRVVALSARELNNMGSPFASLDILFDPGDAMGANLAAQLADLLAGLLNASSWTPICPIVSNHPTSRSFCASVRIAEAHLESPGVPGNAVANRIVDLSRWASCDPVRCTTHNKGVLNGVEALMRALNQDTRAVAASLFSWTLRNGHQQPLVEWHWEEGTLIGSFAASIPCGSVGGTGAFMPLTPLLHTMGGIRSAGDMEALAAAAGLLQNLGALLALATDGILAGHMKLHARKHGA